MASFVAFAQGSPASEPPARASGEILRVDPARLRAALDVLGEDDRPEAPLRLLGLVRVMMDQGLIAPSGFEGWLPGSLVVEIRRRATGLSFHVLGDVGSHQMEVLSLVLPCIPFDEVACAVEAEPSLIGPGFVLVEEDTLSMSVVTYLEDDALSPSPVASAEPEHDEPTFPGYSDPDATIIAAPPSELLRRSVDRTDDAVDERRRRMWRRPW